MKFEVISDQAAEKSFPIGYMCHMLGVTRQGFYRWMKWVPSQRDRDDSMLKAKIRAIFEFHRKRYGVRRIHAELLRSGVQVAYKRVQRLMRELVVGVPPQARKRTTVPAAEAGSLPDLVGCTGICFGNAAAESFWATLKKSSSTCAHSTRLLGCDGRSSNILRATIIR